MGRVKGRNSKTHSSTWGWFPAFAGNIDIILNLVYNINKMRC